MAPVSAPVPLHSQQKLKAPLPQEISAGTLANLPNISTGMEVVQVLALLHYQEKPKEHLSKEISVGTFVCPGNGFIGTKLAKKLVILLYGLKPWGHQLKDNFVITHALLRPNFFIGTGLAHLNVLNL